VIALDAVVEILHPPVDHRLRTPHVGLELGDRRGQRGFLSVLITRGGTPFPLERSVLAKNGFAEAVVRRVER
jgi:hypothetical protein